jgi:hypothetical protein
MDHREADIIINGVRLTNAQSITVRVAVTDFQEQLADEEHFRLLGPIGPAYRARVSEILRLIIAGPQPPAGADREQG